MSAGAPPRFGPFELHVDGRIEVYYRGTDHTMTGVWQLSPGAL
jgi:hypothetical protein